MKFGFGYDKSLSIILTNDDKKRKIIVDFIKSIPKKLYLDLLNQMRDNIKDSYYKEVSVDDIIYFYLIYNINKCITIGSFMKRDSDNNSIFLLNLYPYNEVNDIDDSLLLGSIIYQYKEPYEKYINICDRVEYSLEKNSLGLNFIKKYGHRLLFNKITKRIVIDDSLSFDQFDSLEKRKEKKRSLTKKIFNNFNSKTNF